MKCHLHSNNRYNIFRISCNFFPFHWICTNIIQRKEINFLLVSTTFNLVLGESLKPWHNSITQLIKFWAVQFWLFQYLTVNTSLMLLAWYHKPTQLMIGLRDLSITLTTMFSNSFVPFGWSRSSPTSIFITALWPKGLIGLTSLTYKLPRQSVGIVFTSGLAQKGHSMALTLTRHDDSALYLICPVQIN